MTSKLHLRQGFVFVVVLHLVLCSGQYPKKVQIHVPHNIQHHHHTHTKYHFITVPIIRTINSTAGTTTTTTTTTTTARPAMMMPVVPVIPLGLIPNTTQPQPTQPPVQPQQPTPPPFQPQQPTPPPFQPQQLTNPIPSMYYNNDYELIDMFNRRRAGEQYIRSESSPMKFRQIINVQETKKIPLSELLNFNHLLQTDPPRRIKIEVLPEKTTHVKPTQAIDWNSFQDKLRMENLEYNPDTAAYQSRMEHVLDKPEWAAVKRLLEKHIREDFPGLNVQAEVRQIGASDRADPRVSPREPMDLKHIGYVVIDDKDQKHFVGLDKPIDPVT